MVSVPKSMEKDSGSISDRVNSEDGSTCENPMQISEEEFNQKEPCAKKNSAEAAFPTIFLTNSDAKTNSENASAFDEMSLESLDSTFSFVDQPSETIDSTVAVQKQDQKPIDVISEIFQQSSEERLQEDLVKASEFISECEAISMLYPGINLKKLCQHIKIKTVASVNESIIECGSTIEIWFMVWKGEFEKRLRNTTTILTFGQGHETKLKDMLQTHISTIRPLEANCEYLYLNKDKFLSILKETRMESVIDNGKVVKVLVHTMENDQHVSKVNAATLPVALEIIKTDSEFSDLFFSILPLIYENREKEFYDHFLTLVTKENFPANLMSTLAIWLNQNYKILIRNPDFSEFWESFQDRLLENGSNIFMVLVDVIKKKTPYISINMTRMPSIPLGFEVELSVNSNRVVNIDPESYAFKCGLRDDDEIKYIDNVSTRGMPTKALSELLQKLYSYNLVVQRCPFNVKSMKMQRRNSRNTPITVTVRPTSKFESKPETLKHEDLQGKKAYRSLDQIKKSILASIPSYVKSRKPTDLNQESGYLYVATHDPDSLMGLHDRYKTTGYLKVILEEGTTGIRFYPVNQYTSAHKIIECIMAEFRIEQNEDMCSLYEVSLLNGVDTSCRQIHDHAINLLYRVPIDTRYYFKSPYKGFKLNPEMEILKDLEYSLSDLDPTVFARIWTFMDFCYYVSIPPCQYYYFALKKKENWETHKEVEDFQKRNNDHINFILSTIIREPTFSGRCKLIKYFVNVADAAIKIGGYNLVYVLYCAFNDPDYLRLAITRDRLNNRIKTKISELESFMDASSGSLEYKESIQKFKDSKQNIVPIVGRITTSTICCLDAVENHKGMLDIHGYRCINQKIQNIIYYHDTDINTPELIHLKESNFPQDLTLHLLMDTRLFEFSSELDSGLDPGDGFGNNLSSFSSGQSHGATPTGTINQLVGNLLKNPDKRMYEDIVMMKKCLKFLKEDFAKCFFQDADARELASINCELKPTPIEGQKLSKPRGSYLISPTGTVPTETLSRKSVAIGSLMSTKPVESALSYENTQKRLKSRTSILFMGSQSASLLLEKDKSQYLSPEYPPSTLSSNSPSNESGSSSEVPHTMTKRNDHEQPRTSVRRPVSMAIGSLMLRNLKSHRRASSSDELNMKTKEKSLSANSLTKVKSSISKTDSNNMEFISQSPLQAPDA